jgi:hypothetical protein
MNAALNLLISSVETLKDKANACSEFDGQLSLLKIQNLDSELIDFTNKSYEAARKDFNSILETVSSNLDLVKKINTTEFPFASSKKT